jgi:hypothetical protein
MPPITTWKFCVHDQLKIEREMEDLRWEGSTKRAAMCSKRLDLVTAWTIGIVSVSSRRRRVNEVSG